MLCLKVFPFHIHIIVCKIQGILDIILIGTVKYRCSNVKSKGFCRKTQMDLQHLSDIHTGRHAQRVQYNVQRASVW